MARFRDESAGAMSARQKQSAITAFGRFADPDADLLATMTTIWNADHDALVAAFLDRPSIETARPVATFSDDEDLAAFAAEWIAWHERQPDPRGLLEDADTAAETSRAIDAWKAEEPKPTRMTRARRSTQR